MHSSVSTRRQRAGSVRHHLADEPGDQGRVETAEDCGRCQGGETVSEKGYRGHTPSESTNIKSASKSIVSALVGIAIDKGLLDGPEQKIAPLLKEDLPSQADPRINDITIGNLLSMQAGLGRMSGPNYGRWVSSRNWVRFALAQPFDDEPEGGCFIRPPRPICSRQY